MTAQPNTTLKAVIEAQRQHDYPDMASDDYFEIFAAQQVLKGGRYNADPDEITSGIIGGGGDGGVDAFYIYCNRKLIREDTDIGIFKSQRLDIEIVIVQAKNTSSFAESVPTKFKDFTENCFSSPTPTAIAKKLYSPELLESVGRFHSLYQLALPMRPTLSATFYHVAHSDTVDPKVKARGELLVSAFKQIYPVAKCAYTPITGTELIVLSQKRQESTLPLVTAHYFNMPSFQRDAYTCVVRLGDFYSFISEEGEIREAIFEANVRDYAPDAKVNEGIQKTLANPAGDDFWWLNNGITILASKAYLSSGSLQITDPLIVNGLQTSHVVFHHLKNGGNTNDDRSIMVKVIVNDNAATSDRIISATNSQTKINSIFLHSTEPIHREIELNLKAHGFFYDRRKNYYRNQGKPVSQIITIPYLAQAVASIVLQQPNDARVRPGTVAEKSYHQLFSTKYPSDLYPNCIKLIKRCYKFLTSKGLAKTDVLNLVFYLAMYVTCAACKSARPQRRRIATLDVEAIPEVCFGNCYEWIHAEFIKLGGDDRTAKGPTLTASLRAKVVNEFGAKKKEAKN